MKVKDIMTGEPRTCSPGTNLAAAAAVMLDGDCGILPVVEDGKLVGIVTDRDMYIALATRNKRASEITVREVVQTPVYTCGPDDDVQAALETMKQHCVRRLPVEGFGGTVMGIVSMNDIVLASGPRKPVRDTEVVSTLQAICAHHHPFPTSPRRESGRARPAVTDPADAGSVTSLAAAIVALCLQFHRAIVVRREADMSHKHLLFRSEAREKSCAEPQPSRTRCA